MNPIYFMSDRGASGVIPKDCMTRLHVIFSYLFADTLLCSYELTGITRSNGAKSLRPLLSIFPEDHYLIQKAKESDWPNFEHAFRIFIASSNRQSYFIINKEKVFVRHAIMNTVFALGSDASSFAARLYHLNGRDTLLVMPDDNAWLSQIIYHAVSRGIFMKREGWMRLANELLIPSASYMLSAEPVNKVNIDAERLTPYTLRDAVPHHHSALTILEHITKSL